MTLQLNGEMLTIEDINKFFYENDTVEVTEEAF